LFLAESPFIQNCQYGNALVKPLQYGNALLICSWPGFGVFVLVFVLG
jgi:hypothetical protein